MLSINASIPGAPVFISFKQKGESMIEQTRYPWPASAVSESDMGLLYRARESSQVRTPITQLIVRAVREAYGHLAETQISIQQPEQLKEAA